MSSVLFVADRFAEGDGHTIVRDSYGRGEALRR